MGGGFPVPSAPGSQMLPRSSFFVVGWMETLLLTLLLLLLSRRIRQGRGGGVLELEVAWFLPLLRFATHDARRHVLCCCLTGRLVRPG